jgi:hypothetical protein
MNKNSFYYERTILYLHTNRNKCSHNPFKTAWTHRQVLEHVLLKLEVLKNILKSTDISSSETKNLPLCINQPWKPRRMTKIFQNVGLWWRNETKQSFPLPFVSVRKNTVEHKLSINFISTFTKPLAILRSYILIFQLSYILKQFKKLIFNSDKYYIEYIK